MNAAFATIGVFIAGLLAVGAYIYFTSSDKEEKAHGDEKPHHA